MVKTAAVIKKIQIHEHKHKYKKNIGVQTNKKTYKLYKWWKCSKPAGAAVSVAAQNKVTLAC